MSHDEDDYEESLISQFETTLTIKPSNQDDEDEDLSIDHTVYTTYSGRDQSTIDINELEEEEVLLEQIPKFKTKSNRRLSLIPSAAKKTTKHSNTGSRRLLPSPSFFDDILAPSPLIDYSLTKFQKNFQLFLASNPHISKDSPKFSKEQDKTLILLSPYSAEHAFGRKWVTKSYLSTIFERPQRLLAACIGVALAISMYPFFYRVENSTKRGSILSPHVRKVHGKNWPTKLYELCLESHEKLQEDKLEVPEDWNTGDIYLNPKTINALEGVIGTLEAAVDALYDKGPKIPKSKVVKQESSGSINDREKSPPVVGDAGAAGSAAAASPMANRTRSTSASSNNSGRSRSSSNSSNNTLENSSLTAASLAFVVIRPPGHHSHACLPSGFCLLNNVQIAVEYAFDTYNVTHVAILDIDLHHGDGSQDICWERAGFTGDYGKEDNDEEEDLPERNDYGKRFALYPKVGYFSLHDIKSYPTELGFATKDNIRNASTCVMDHDVNIWNVHLQEWTTEEEFYKHYQTKYVAILNRANQFLNQSKKQYDQEQASYLQQLSNYNKVMLKPHLYPPQHVQQLKPPIPPPPFKPLIMISAGFDALEYENPQMQRHGVNVPTSFYATFTKDVVKLAKIHTGGKVISFLEGGYSDGALTTGIFSHLIGLTNDLEMNNLWNDTWGTEQVMKELVKGCKKTWSSYKKPQTDVTIWANEVIKLGRSLMPNCILPANYMYKYVDPQESKIGMSNMVKELQRDNERYATTTIPQVHVEDERRRVTRSYYKKTEGNA